MKKLTRSRIILPVLVLLTCLVISYLNWDVANTNRENELRSYFEYRARDVKVLIEQRIIGYEQILRSMRGLFNASDNVNRTEFRTFFNSLSLEKNYPGIQGVGFSLIIPSEQIKKHITTIRNEGFTEYKIWPEGNRETYTSIIYLEPFRDLNLRAFGYDMYSEPVRRKAMATSRDLNKTVISRKVNLVQETGKEVQAGFLIYLPVYRYGTQNTTLTERHTNIVGWVYSPFRMGDFMEGILGEGAADLAIEIYDGKNILNETKMYSSITHPTGLHQPLGIKKVIEFNKHEWTVLVKYTPKLESRIGSNTAVIILIVGISLSILLAIITWLLVNKRMRTILADTERKRSEESLQESEERFRTAAETLTDVIYEWDIKQKLDWYGDIDGITGYPPGEFPRTIEGWEAVIHPEDKDRIITALENHINGTAPYNTEYRIKRSDGGWRWWSARGTALRDDQGNPYKMIGSITDITEQKDIQNRIKFNSDLLSHIGQSVIATDLQGNVIYWNNGAEEIYGWSSAEAIGQNIVDLTPTEQTKENAAEIMKALSEGSSWSGEFLVKRKDGSIFPADVTDAPIIDSDGKLIGVVGISSDITERKRTEIERKVLYEITYGVTTTNNLDELLKLIHQSLSKVVYAENCFVALHDQNTGLFSFPFYEDKYDPTPKTAPLDKSCTSYVFRTGKSLLLSDRLFEQMVEQGEVELIGTNSPSWIGVPLKINFNTIGVLVLQHYEKENVYTERDIMFLEAVGREIAHVIERKLTEEETQKHNKQLFKLNAEKDKFFSIIAHDLKSPLSSLLNMTELMADNTENFSQAEFTENSKLLNESARNLYKLLENLLEWAQIQKGTIEFTPKDFDLSKLVSRSIDTISQWALQKKIEIKNEIHNSQKVYADERIIETILRNLLSNAVKFTKTGGKVNVKTKRFENSTIQVSIEDNGVGISEDNVKKLFKIDQKVGSIGTEGEPSTGLGLLLCKEFVEMHGQRIWVESVKDKGSTFCFTLRKENCYETK